MPGGFRARRAAESHECDYRAACARVRVELEAAQATHGRQVAVNAAKVLDLLNPRGMWRYIDQSTQPMEEIPSDEEVDPITGCRSAAAQPPSGPDKVQAAVRAARGGPPPPPVQGYA